MNAQSIVNLRSDNKMPVLGLGTWKLIGDACFESVSTALELGYRMIDTSSDYNNHKQVGKAIEESNVPREEIFLVTKVEENDNSYEATIDYLQQLDQTYADLVLIHRPPQSGVGADLWKGLIQAKSEGLTKDIGVSNYLIDQIEKLVKSTGVVPTVNQIEWSPVGHSIEMLRHCRRNDIVVQAYSPLTRHERLEEAPISDLAEKYGKTSAQLLIRWNIQHKVVPIIKATSREHLEENLGVFDFSISNTDMDQLDNLNEEYSSLGRKLQYA